MSSNNEIVFKDNVKMCKNLQVVNNLDINNKFTATNTRLEFKKYTLLKCNTNVLGNLGVAKTIELTFLYKKLFDKIPELNITNLPINQLDFPNCEWKKDIMLNFYPFVNVPIY